MWLAERASDMAANDFELRFKDNFWNYRVFRDVCIGLKTLAKKIEFEEKKLPENVKSGSFLFNLQTFYEPCPNCLG